MLVREPGWPDIRFNLSHSGRLALCAVASARRVGIDVERIDPNRVDMSVAAQFFSINEEKALSSLTERDQVHGFFNCWTRKEAFLKGRGEGLSLCLAAFDVSLSPGQPAALLASRIDPSEVDRWHLRHLAVAEGYAAALAIESFGRPTAVRRRVFGMGRFLG